MDALSTLLRRHQLGRGFGVLLLACYAGYLAVSLA